MHPHTMKEKRDKKFKRIRKEKGRPKKKRRNIGYGYDKMKKLQSANQNNERQ